MSVKRNREQDNTKRICNVAFSTRITIEDKKLFVDAKDHLALSSRQLLVESVDFYVRHRDNKNLK